MRQEIGKRSDEEMGLKRVLLALMFVVLSLQGVLITHAAPVSGPHRIGVFESAHVGTPEAIDRLKLINDAIPNAEVVNYGWTVATPATMDYVAEAHKLGMVVDPGIYDYTLDKLDVGTNKGLQFVQAVKDRPGIGRYFIYDELLTALKDPDRSAVEGLDQTVLPQYLEQMQAYNAKIHELDPNHKTWGVVECYPDNASDMAQLISQLVTPGKNGFAAVDEVGCDTYTYTKDLQGDLGKIAMGAQALSLVEQPSAVAPYAIQVNDLGPELGIGTPPRNAVCGAMEAVAKNDVKAQLWLYDPLNFTNHPSGMISADQTQLKIIHECLVQNNYLAAA